MIKPLRPLVVAASLAAAFAPAAPIAGAETIKIVRIKPPGTNTVIIDNRGDGLALPIKATKDADLKAYFYTYGATVHRYPAHFLPNEAIWLIV